MIEISPNESTILKFKVDVEGTEETPQPRLVIPISKKGVSLVFEGNIKKDEVSVDVKELLKLTDSKEFSGKLEVIVEDSFFIPWEDKIVIKKSTTVKAKTVKNTIKESKKIQVKAKNKADKETVMEIKKKDLKDMLSDKL